MIADGLKRAIYLMIRIAARISIRGTAESVVAKAALAAIAGYQFVLSPLVGRDCLFRPTCSHRAARLITELGWNQGIREVLLQISDCGGNFALLQTQTGTLMITRSGRRIPEAELAPHLRSKLPPLASSEGAASA